MQQFEEQRRHHPQIKLTTAQERIAKLKLLGAAIRARTPEIHQALMKDLHKPSSEVDLTEIFTTMCELEHAIRYLKKWMRPKCVKTPLSLFGTRSEIRHEPKGVVLIIGPWNYPFSLMMIPLISAIAAGNCAILKPSEISENMNVLLCDMIAKLFDPREVLCLSGDASLSQKLCALPFDHVFFTGSGRVGQAVMEAAAKNLTPVTLELGGKSPVIIEESADLESAAQRIVWGKFINAGQTCIAPDYIFVPENKLPLFIEKTKHAIERHYGPDAKAQKSSSDYCRMITERHYDRLKKIIVDSIALGAKAQTGAVFDDQEKYIAPTLLTEAKPGQPVMHDEIFGPILPVMTYKTLDEVYTFLRSHDKPLALYIFSKNKNRIEEILNNTTAGGTSINNTLVHVLNPYLPFGGIGASGTGNYHGFFGFRTFSHERAVTRQVLINSLSFLYPPYTNFVQKLIHWTLKYLT